MVFVFVARKAGTAVFYRALRPVLDEFGTIAKYFRLLNETSGPETVDFWGAKLPPIKTHRKGGGRLKIGDFRAGVYQYVLGAPEVLDVFGALVEHLRSGNEIRCLSLKIVV